MYIVLTVCLLLFIYALYSWHKRNIFGHKLPPILPGALPFIGHNLIIYSYRNDFVTFLKNAINFTMKSGGVSCIYFVNFICYAIIDVEDAHTISNTCGQKFYLYQLAAPWLGQGLVTASGPTFYSHRKMLKPAFSLSVAYGFLNVFNDQCRLLTEFFDGLADKGPIDTRKTFQDLSLRTSCITILGGHDEKYNHFINTYIAATNDIIETIKHRVLSIWLQNEFLFQLSSLKKKQDEQIQLINGTLQEAIDRKKDELKYKTNVDNSSGSDVGFRCFLDILLEIAADGLLSDQEIKDELNTVAAASYETTSRQLVYIIILLGTYPDIQEKVYQEVMEEVGDRDLEKDNIPKLVYLEAFLKECLRIVPVVNVLPKYLDKDVKLKNYTLRAGNPVLLFKDAIHRQPAFGPDAKEFRPERWLEKEKQLENQHLAFGYGQRVCVGKKYAMVFMKVTVSHIVRKFKIKGDFNKLKSKFELLTAPESGHEITLERRNL